MTALHTFKDAIDLAIKKEKEAVEFYTKALEIVKSPGTKTMLKDFASQEQKHVELLQDALRGKTMERIGNKKLPPTMDLTRYLVSEPLRENSTPQDLMVVAMKREDMSIALYTEQITTFQGTDLEDVFQKLLKMEKEHKEFLESEYDRIILQDN